jgi:uncharacterized protein (TIGR03437 family)
MSCLRLFALLALPAFVCAETKTPSLGYTGAPTDHGGKNCSTCHSDNGPANSDKTGTLQVSVTDYIPTVAQTIRVTVQHPQAFQWGFQITIREESDETLSSGVFSVIDSQPVQVACDDGTQFGSPGPCNGTIRRQFAEHLNAPKGVAGSAFEFDVQWMPPDQEVGRLHVYVAAVAANGDGTANGDHVYTAVKELNNAGTCDFTKTPLLQNVLNGASFQTALTSKAMISIFGTNFQTQGRARGAGFGDFVNGAFPTELGCVGVKVNGPGLAQPVRLPIAFVDATQINAQMPEFSGTGPLTVNVILNPDTMNAITSSTGTFNTLQAFAPALFQIPNSTSVAAVEALTGKIVADPTVVPGAAPAKPGDIVSLFGTGFGSTKTPVGAGELATGVNEITEPITVKIGDVTLASSDVLYAGLSPGSISGLYQFNVRIPTSTADGDIPVSITIGSVTTPAATITVHK